MSTSMSGSRFQGEGRAVGDAAVQWDVMTVPFGPRGNLVAVVRTAWMSAGARDTHGPQTTLRIGEVGDHAVTGTHLGCVGGTGRCAAHRRGVSRGRRAIAIEQFAQIA